jgi:signal transduction histidine kinase
MSHHAENALIRFAKRHQGLGVGLALAVAVIGLEALGAPYLSRSLHLPLDLLLGATLAAVGALYDKLRRAVERSQTLERELVQSNEALQCALRQKNELLEIASHNLKNPLHTILGYSELIRSAPDTDSVVIRRAHYIENAARQMFTIIYDLLEGAATESGAISLKLEVCDIGHLLEKITESGRQKAEKKRQTLQCATEPNCLVRIDPERMREALENLISNAMKYSPSGKRIWATARRRDGVIRIEVRDEGPGLTLDDQQRLWDRSAKLSPRPTDGESSNRLGLVIAKQIIDLHDGKIWVESEGANRGATFFIELPVAKPLTPSVRQPA